MAYRILILTGAREAPHLRKFVRRLNPDLPVSVALGDKDLVAQLRGRADHTRLISFLTDVIVPAEILEALGPTPYNIHPGPPEYPGSKPEAFALFDGAREFGVTVHEIAVKVDDGPIVHVERFDIDPLAERISLGDQTYALAVNVFAKIAEYCAHNESALPTVNESWGVTKGTNKKFRTLCRRPAPSHEELEHLMRCCGADYVGPDEASAA